MNQAQEQANVHVQGTAAHPWFDLAEMNRELAAAPAEQRVAWVLKHFPGRVVLTSSFGAQSAVCLHMVTRQQPDIPVVLVDTGYLFPETYQFIDELSERLSLNLQIYRAELSAAWEYLMPWCSSKRLFSPFRISTVSGIDGSTTSIFWKRRERAWSFSKIWRNSL